MLSFVVSTKAFALLLVLAFTVVSADYPPKYCHEYGIKDDCGFLGIDADICNNHRSCCWKKTSEEGVPWCFQRLCGQGSGTRPTVCDASHEREDCGYNGISKDECEDRNCCWEESSVAGVPWCFQKVCESTTPEPHADDHQQNNKECQGNKEKFDCACEGISKDACDNGRNCCYDDNADPGDPWCAQKYCVDTGAMPEYCDGGNRVDCGCAGTTEAQCVERGCCWESSEAEGAPWCFQKVCDKPDEVVSEV